MEAFKEAEINELIMRCRDGDEEAFESLVHAYTPMMTAQLSAMGLDSSAFTDAAHALYRAALSYDTEQRGVTLAFMRRFALPTDLPTFCVPSGRCRPSARLTSMILLRQTARSLALCMRRRVLRFAAARESAFRSSNIACFYSGFAGTRPRRLRVSLRPRLNRLIMPSRAY